MNYVEIAEAASGLQPYGCNRRFGPLQEHECNGPIFERLKAASQQGRAWVHIVCVEEFEDVPVYSLIQTIRVGDS